MVEKLTYTCKNDGVVSTSRIRTRFTSSWHVDICIVLSMVFFDNTYFADRNNDVPTEGFVCQLPPLLGFYFCLFSP